MKGRRIENEKKGKEKHVYIYIADSDKHSDLLQDRPVALSGRTPHDRQNHKYSY